MTPLQQKLLIAFESDDTALVDTSATGGTTNFYTLFDYQNTKEYLWSKQATMLNIVLENMDVNRDESTGCLLYSEGSNPGTIWYDLLFINMTDGALIKYIYASSADFSALNHAVLFFYNSKVYFLMYETSTSNIGFHIWNEAIIATWTYSGSF